MKTFEQMRKDLLKEAGIRRKELQTVLSGYDMILQDALHFLENEKCDAIAMVQIAKKIKDVRMRRRTVKIELEKLQSVTDSITKGVARFDKKDYTYRTTAMKSIRISYRKGN
jgi:uncharacterized protein YjiS (DUF1127 family)